MSRLSIAFAASAFFVGAVVDAAEDKPVKDGAAERVAAQPYRGFKADQALLRNHPVHKARNGKETRASSPEACLAAQRIFSRVPFLFRTREEVLDLLGDPATVSDYNRPAGRDPEGPLVYVFDTGFGGLRYSIRFGKLDRVRVTRVEVESQD